MAGTINVANIAIGFDPSKLKAGIDLSRKEINQLNKNLRETLDPVTKMGLEVYQLSEALRVGAISAERFDAAYEVIAKKFGVITPKAKAEAEALERLASAEKKAADNAAYLDRLKKNSKEMELRNKEKFRDDEERQRIALQQRGSQITQNAQTELERYISSKKELKQLLNSNNISQETYNRTLSDMRANLSWNIDATNKENEFQKQGVALKQQAMTATERYAASIKSLQQQFRAQNINAREYLALVKQSKQENFGGGGGILSFGRMTAAGTAAGFAYQAINLLTAGFGELTIGSAKLAAELEVSTVAFEVVTESVDKAQKMLQQMRKLDKESPLNFMSIQKAGKTLVGYGMEVDKIMPSLTALSKISLGNSERFELLSLALAQVASRGKLAGDEVRQMVNQGFNPLFEIATMLANEKGGKAADYMEMLRKKMEDGKITFELVTMALEEATTATGRYAQINEEMVNTVTGKWNKLRSNIDEVRISIGQSIEPVTKALLDAANAFADSRMTLAQRGFNIGEGLSALSNPLHYSMRNMGKELSDRANKINKEAEKNKAKQGTGGTKAQDALDAAEKKANAEKLAKETKEKEDKFRDKLKNELAQIDKDISAKMRRDGMDAKSAVMDEKFFDLQEELKSVFYGNAVELQNLNNTMQLFSAQFDKELKIKQKEIQDKANEKTKNLQDKFSEWLKKSSNPDGITSNKTEMLQRDSVEAYKFLIKQQDTLEKRREEIAEKQKDLTEEIRDINKKMQEDMKDAPRLVKI